VIGAAVKRRGVRAPISVVVVAPDDVFVRDNPLYARLEAGLGTKAG
jgi:hypothetical protein